MQTQGNGALPHEEARQGANPKEAVALLAELLGQLGDVLGHDLFNLGNVLVSDDLLASLFVDDFLSLVEAPGSTVPLISKPTGASFLRFRALKPHSW